MIRARASAKDGHSKVTEAMLIQLLQTDESRMERLMFYSNRHRNVAQPVCGARINAGGEAMTSTKRR